MELHARLAYLMHWISGLSFRFHRGWTIAAIFLGLFFGIYFGNSKRGSGYIWWRDMSFTSVFCLRLQCESFAFARLMTGSINVSFPCVSRFLRDHVRSHYQLSSSMQDHSLHFLGMHVNALARASSSREECLQEILWTLEFARSAFVRYCRDIKFILPFPDTLLLLFCSWNICRKREGKGRRICFSHAGTLHNWEGGFRSSALFHHSRYVTCSKWMGIRFVYSQQTRYLATKRWILLARFM